MTGRRALAVGDRVAWHSHGGRAVGTIVRIAHENGEASGFHFKATRDDPRYIVETDDGRQAAHRADALEPV